MPFDYFIYVISDAFGITAESVARAAARQFTGKHYRMHTFPNITKEYQLTPIIQKAVAEPAPVIVVFTTVLEQIRNSIISECEAHDDGKAPEGIMKADLVLIGVSRTSKTPLSMYLAYLNYRVINIPLVQYTPVPEALFKINAGKIIGLVIQPDLLNKIRIERTRLMGYRQNDHYVSMTAILDELEYANKIMRKLGCAVIDVSNKAIEETANEILEIILNQ